MIGASCNKPHKWNKTILKDPVNPVGALFIKHDFSWKNKIVIYEVHSAIKLCYARVSSHFNGYKRLREKN